eukprot:TRINITY_DN7440_c0_g1_i1.p1 TRINITY_DN7440_c0_g1~~TRINITY_DN7440_c0_g1_i1.p1  ORF type:complete len:509 (-),score=106.13 TRINITY_DN7440_c0_g1_i1:115-1512(-)
MTPYTKVEESFNLQAAHDILKHGADIASYDHLQFPGSVPRTFLGAFAAALMASPAVIARLPPLALQYAVRLALGLLSVAAHARLRRAVTVALGVAEGRCMLVVVALQFHLPFYMSRTLPNTFALMLANVAYAEMILGNGYTCLAVLSAAAAIFRCDLLVMIAPMGLMLLAQKRVKFVRAAATCAGAAMVAAIVSIAVDSIMWGRLLWPELEVLWFNTAENKSSDWGTSPPLWYFYSALPRALLGAAPLAALGAALERRVRAPLVVAIAFVALYSGLPHKELRFLFPALPLFNVAAAAGAARCWRLKGVLRAVAALALAALAMGTLLATCVLTAASARNYPGGVAMVRLHVDEPSEPALSVHVGNLAAISGVSRFLEGHKSWSYSKEEDLSPAELARRGFDRLLTEWPEVPGYSCQAAVEGFERIALHLKPLRFPPLELVRRPQVYILKRSSDGVTTPCSEAAPLW